MDIIKFLNDNPHIDRTAACRIYNKHMLNYLIKQEKIRNMRKAIIATGVIVFTMVFIYGVLYV